jgi:hypothetical protein
LTFPFPRGSGVVTGLRREAAVLRAVIRGDNSTKNTMKTTRCRHNRKQFSERCFSCAVAWRQNPKAHGNITQLETCLDCGSMRRTNVNGIHKERGPWIESEEAISRH